MRPNKINWIFFAFAFMNVSFAWAQEDLMAELNKTLPKEQGFKYATFKGTRLVNLHTVETRGRGTLEFRIAHRFGDFSSGANNLWGLDGPATIQFHLDYAITDRFMVGVGRASYNKMFDAFAKYKWLRQTTDNSMPLTLTFLGSTNVTSNIDPNKALNGADRYQYFSNRVAYLAQVMIARKFNSNLSLQISPLYIHYNLVNNLTDQNDIFAVGLSSRFKITSSLALTGEYIYRVNKYSRDFDLYHNALSLGFDLETGGHVFQVFLTNSIGINEVSAVPYTESSWSKGQVRLGFNISRVFGLTHKTPTIHTSAIQSD